MPTTISTPGLEGLDLGLVGATAVDRQHPDAPSPPGPLEVARHLHGELTGRGDRQGLRLARAGQGAEGVVAGRHDLVQHRDAEAEGLAGAGLGLSDDVVPAEGHGQGHRLDGERRADTDVGQGRDDVGVDGEVGEGRFGHVVGSLRRSLDGRLGDGLDREVGGRLGRLWGGVVRVVQIVRVGQVGQVCQVCHGGLSISTSTPRRRGSSVARDGPIGECRYGAWRPMFGRFHRCSSCSRAPPGQTIGPTGHRAVKPSLTATA